MKSPAIRRAREQPHAMTPTNLTTDDVAEILDDLRRHLAKEACTTCDCVQAFVTELEFDAGHDVSDLTDPWKVPRDEMHGCLGCDPCPPCAAMSDYLRKRKRNAKRD